MNTQLLTGVIAALGLLASLGQAGPARAQDDAGAGLGLEHHQHADFISDRLHVRIDGEPAGPGVRDIILIPGLSSSPEIWQGTVDHLLAEPGTHWRIHRIHIQGFAGAPTQGNGAGPVAAPVAEEIARYISENHIAAPAVVGHSMGGTIGLMLAARHPELLGRLMVVDMLPSLGPVFAGPTATREQIEAAGQRTHDAIASETGDERIASATETIGGMVKTEAKRAGPIQDTLKSDPDVMARAMQELVVSDVSPEFANITAPVEVLYVTFPQAGDAMTGAIYRGAYARLPGVTLKHVDDSAHFIMLDQPDVFNAELDAFLAK
ncbi:alpha/beta hydrolase [soil metagenome]